MIRSRPELLAPLVLLFCALAARAQSTLPVSAIDAKAASVATVDAALCVAADGRSGRLSVTADIEDGFHIYGMAQPKPFIATEIRLDRPARLQVTGPFQENPPPRVRFHKILGIELHEHEGRVTWTAPVRLAEGVDPGELAVAGRVYAQACDAHGCLPPAEYPFTARVTRADQHAGELPGATTGGFPTLPPGGSPNSSSADSPTVLPDGLPIIPSASPGEQSDNSAVALDDDRLKAHSGGGAPSLAIILATAFVAGFILNFMPCVLPVIGLKILAFAQQAGESRSRALVLNVWYSAGLISVFLVLATLSVFLGLGWGEQFSSVAFNAALASVVFVFALSFLGVWEIPIPGFVGSGMAGEVADKEGAAGAFSKGVLTTVLATPCSGPLLGSALAWAIAQPPTVAYAAFASVGLGMASPYLVIGAFPRLIALLPKPGAWMITFKQIMGFVLLGTVVFVLSFIPVAYVVPTLAFMIGLWAACWWVGRIPPTAARHKRATAWVWAAATAALVGWFSFGPFLGIMESRFRRAVDRELALREVGPTTTAEASRRDDKELTWQPFSRELLQRYAAEQKTVLVDFTADWCLTCKANEAIALNTEKTRRLIDANRVVTLKADKTRPAPQVDRMLTLLGNTSGAIPFYAIFPAGKPNQPILLDGLFTSPGPIVKALEQAGPSLNGA